jgi:hypothetical protein
VELARSVQGKDMLLKRLSHKIFFYKTQDNTRLDRRLLYSVDPLLDFLVFNSVGTKAAGTELCLAKSRSQFVV